ncbi:Flagellar synthesis regulator FleN [Olavius algarvensis Delta 1 endosymbiont]|nr:Flagellar synthesis regulator FleN [Olavius algarvensis Delta 1 endosymbiont]
MLGIESPASGIGSFLNRSVDHLEQVAAPTNVPNLSFISSMHCAMEIPNLPYLQKQKIIRAIRKLPFDYVILDLGAGTNFNTLDFFLTASEGIFICIPEPTSIENAFRFVQATYSRKIKNIIRYNDFNAAVQHAVFNSNSAQRISLQPSNIVDIVARRDPDKEIFLKDKLSEFNFKLILNQVRNNSDPALGQKIETACNRHMHASFHYLGSIKYDERVPESIFSKNLYVNKYPYTTISNDLKTIAAMITKNNAPASELNQLG